MLQEILDNTHLLRAVVTMMTLMLIASYYAKKMILRVMPFSLFRFLITPGVAIHELSHAAGCFLTGAKVESIVIFDAEGGSVQHGQPYLKFLGPTIIAMAPIFGGLGMFYLWIHLIQTPFASMGNSSDLMTVVRNFFDCLGQVQWLTWQTWVFFYGCLNLIICVSPSLQDFKNCKWELVIIVLVLAVLEFLKVFSGAIPAGTIYRYTAPLILMAAFFVLLALPFYLLVKRSIVRQE